MKPTPDDLTAAACPVPAHHPPAARVVYFVASHVCPEQVVRLAGALQGSGSGSRVVIHHDMNVSTLDRGQVLRLGRVDWLEQMPIGYGTFVSTSMVLSAIEWICDHYDFDYIVYLSGQDYPIKPLGQIERELGREIGRCDAFLDARPARQCTWQFGPERYLYRYFQVPPLPGLHRVRSRLRKRSEAARKRATQSGGPPRNLPWCFVPAGKRGQGAIGLRPPVGLFGPRGWTVYAGSAWWTMSRRAAEYAVRFVREHPAVARHYRRVLYAPSESLLMTVLLNAPDLAVRADDNKRFIRWTNPQSGHPDLLSADDFEALVASPHHFARKIDQRSDPRLLDLLDEFIGGPRAPLARSASA